LRHFLKTTGGIIGEFLAVFCYLFGLTTAEIRKYSESTYRVALLSMHTGMRFGEIAGLLWQHVKVNQGYILVLDPKNTEGRTVYMNDAVKELFAAMEPGKPNSLVFPSNRGTKMTSVSNTFTRAVETLGLNEGITDRRMKVVFHTLRHSCASWLANSGVDMQEVGKVLGHKSLTMTMRYSHINDSKVKNAMQLLDLQTKEEKVMKTKRRH
jgi:integrase